MAAAKGRILRLLSGVALNRAVVVDVEQIGGFRRVLAQCQGQSFAAGTKIQVLLPSNDVRTYTPIARPEGMALLGWVHGDGPGARWLGSLQVGDELRFVGPQRSLEVAEGLVVLVGDETSVAVAAALAAERPGQVRAVIQAAATAQVPEAAQSVDLRRIDVVPPGDTASTAKAVETVLSAWPKATVVLTGGSDLVVRTRDALRDVGVDNMKTKAYWIPGRTGLD